MHAVYTFQQIKNVLARDKGGVDWWLLVVTLGLTQTSWVGNALSFQVNV